MINTVRRSRSTASGRAVAFATLVLFAALGTSSAVALASGADATDATANASGDATVQVALDDAPEGLAGYKLELTVDGGTVTGASYPDHYQPTTDPIVSDDGRAVTIEAADVQDAVEDGASDVRLATVEAEALDGQSLEVSVRDAQLDADGGTRIDPAAVTFAVDGGQDAGAGTPSDGSGTARAGEAGDREVPAGTVQAPAENDAAPMPDSGSNPVVWLVAMAVALLALVAIGRYAGRE